MSDPEPILAAAREDTGQPTEDLRFAFEEIEGVRRVRCLSEIYARGFGWADRENKKPVQPGTLFRIASDCWRLHTVV